MDSNKPDGPEGLFCHIRRPEDNFSGLINPYLSGFSFRPLSRNNQGDGTVSRLMFPQRARQI
ncbi:hypothetical protein BOX30_01980 [Leptospirillum ferriphilum]|nr:hypothetical protein ABH19_13280 [Leptospirillum sp. Group II 'CF-1']OOH83731.1 hypothetical protein BOX30_01980 [Leptospirillum ferriphilum]